MKSTYSSNRQYTPVLLTFGILLLLCAVIGIQQFRAPEAFQNSRQITVTYVQDGFTRKKAVTVGLLEEPTPPEKEGYRFEGWFYSQDGTQRQWNFARDEADADLTLTARLTPIPYTLTLDPNGGTCGKKHKRRTQNISDISVYSHISYLCKKGDKAVATLLFIKFYRSFLECLVVYAALLLFYEFGL